MILPYLPASNLLQTVGFVAAERTLYSPSIGNYQPAEFQMELSPNVRWLKRDEMFPLQDGVFWLHSALTNYYQSPPSPDCPGSAWPRPWSRCCWSTRHVSTAGTTCGSHVPASSGLGWQTRGAMQRSGTTMQIICGTKRIKWLQLIVTRLVEDCWGADREIFAQPSKY